MDAPKLISSIFGNWIRGENIATATENVLGAEGERLCIEGVVNKLYDSRATIFLATAGVTAGLVLLGGYLKEKV